MQFLKGTIVHLNCIGVHRIIAKTFTNRGSATPELEKIKY